MNEGMLEESTEGTPQGGNLSPMLAKFKSEVKHKDKTPGTISRIALREDSKNWTNI